MVGGCLGENRTSSNKFVVKEFKPPVFSTKPEDPVNPTKNRKRQATTTDAEDTSEPSKEPNRNLGNMIGDVLNGNFQTVALNIGTIGPRPKCGIQKNYKADHSISVINHIQSTIQDLVKLNTDLVR
ncbi:hypothetical protein BGZ65_003642 [Modicella reniformis]|uniref:Uncharacterized protein n=1 Tax=Modicella reniformis TaxID=1440133 RepID=A0A9P6MBD5_9FUNG|nr:hypothetical protein BGZ65_003642 [Modicella reniformis]